MSFAAWHVFRGIVVLFSMLYLYHAYHYLSATVNFNSSVSVVVRLGAGLPGNRNLSFSPISRVNFRLRVSIPPLAYTFACHTVLN